MTVSRLALEKNIEFLLHVTRALLDEFPDLLFLIAGEGPDAQRLKALETENTKLKKLLANSMLEIDAMREVLKGK